MMAFFSQSSSHQIARHQRAVFIGQAIPDAPVVKLARGDSQPGDEPPGWDLGTLGPIGEVIDDGVAYVVGNPGAGQSSPSSFFSWICSSINSATTSFLRWSLSRSAAMVRTCDC